MTTKEKIIEVPQPEFREIWVTVEGMTPLLQNRFTEDAQEEIMNKQGGKAKMGRKPRNPEEIAHNALHSMNGGGPPYGFPSGGLQKAMAMAGYRFANQKTTEINGCVNVLGDLLEIEGGEPVRDSRPAKIPGRNGSWTIAHRGRFDQWEIKVPIRYNASIMSLEQVLNLISLAGFSVGIGCFRVENKGTFGQFRIKEVQEIES